VGDPTQWLYVPHPTKKTENYHEQHSKNGRLTWQINERHKLSGFFDHQWRCVCPRALTPLELPESGTEFHYPWAHVTSVTWSSPFTSRLLFEAGVLHHPEQWHNPAEDDLHHVNDGIGPLPHLVQVTEQSTGMNYRGRSGLVTNDMVTWRARAAVSYVTGSHAVKVGMGYQWADRYWLDRAPANSTTGIDLFDPNPKVEDWVNRPPMDYSNLSFRFNNGVPNQLTQYLRPELNVGIIGLDLGIFAQDKMTFGKLTMNLGARFDTLNTYYPEQHLGPTRFAPARDIPLARKDWLGWKDIVPRMSMAYDLFGDGRTAVKASLNKYVLAVGLQGFFGNGSNPISLFGSTTTRSWNDLLYPAGDPRRGNYYPDCDLLSAAGNAECGPMTNASFGQPLPVTEIDPAILRGWGSRAYSWEFGTDVQHQISPRVSVDVGYYRRWYGNFVAVDNRATTINDYKRFSITAPLDPRLPNGGGYVIDGLYDLNPDKVGVMDKFYTFSDNYGKQVENWHGVDLAVNTRLGAGIILQGGFSTGRTVFDNCELLAKSPEIVSSTSPPNATTEPATSPAGVPYCYQNSGFINSFKTSGSYLVPVIGVQTSASFQSFLAPGTGGISTTIQFASDIAANFNASNAVVAPSLGRPLAAGASNVTVNLVAPGALKGDRVNQFDMSVSKVLRFGRTRTTVKADVFNIFNANPVLTENANFARWRAPLSILQTRFVKLGVQFDF
jgi:hypothetical protein